MAGSTGGIAEGGAGKGADGGSSWSCPAGPFGSPIPSGATLTQVAGVPPPDPAGSIDQNGKGFSTIEGPVWVGDSLYVSEFPAGPTPPSRIIRITSAGIVSVVGPTGWDPGTNGLAVDIAGLLYGAVHEDGSVSSLDVTNGTRTPIVSNYPVGGPRFNSPNDLTIRSDGTIYFSDPNYQAPTVPPQSITGLYRVAP
ncbi:MAG: hypothetical protein ABSC94_31240, partial [Polyangiaceae bacterium]